MYVEVFKTIYYKWGRWRDIKGAKFLYFMIKTQENNNWKELTQHDKEHLWKKPISKIIFSGKRLSTLPIRPKPKQEDLSPLLFNVGLEILNSLTKQEEEIECI